MAVVETAPIMEAPKKEKMNSGQFWRRIIMVSPFLMPNLDKPAAVLRDITRVSVKE